jgi:hypothetical protein
MTFNTPDVVLRKMAATINPAAAKYPSQALGTVGRLSCYARVAIFLMDHAHWMQEQWTIMIFGVKGDQFADEAYHAVLCSHEHILVDSYAGGGGKIHHADGKITYVVPGQEPYDLLEMLGTGDFFRLYFHRVLPVPGV